MTAPTPNRVSAWVQTHKRQAAAAGAGAGVIALALISRHRSASVATGSASTGDAATSQAADQAGDTTAGLTGTPYTGDTDVYDAIQGQIDNLASQLNASLATPTAPAAPASAPPAAPKPGTQRYKVQKGDTLSKIAMEVYGRSDPAAIAALRHGTPILSSFGDGSSLSYYAGDTIDVPTYHAAKTLTKGRTKPAAKPATKHVKPTPRRRTK